jgi:hypothetical protein
MSVRLIRGKMKPKKCKVCAVEFEPVRSFQKACSPKCAISLVESEKVKKRAKVLRKEKKARKEKLKSRSDWLREAQAAVNAYIRARDRDEPCISCGRHHEGQYHAGHYRSVGSAPELRFNELNIWKQCSSCNNYLSGNLIEYRKRLLEKIGQEKLDWLEGQHEPKKYTIEQIREIKALYKLKIKELKDV